LKWKVIKVRGNSFPVDPDIRLQEGTNSIIVRYPWKSRNIPNTAKIAQTIIVYWEYPQTKGLTVSEKPAHFTVTLNSMYIVDNSDPFINQGAGDCVFYANVGNNWLMLNEFATKDRDVLHNGLGAAGNLKNYDLSTPEIRLYLRPGKQFRIHIRGWENDHMNTQMGKILNEYSRSTTTIKPFLGDIFSLGGIVGGQIEDDDMSEAKVVITSDAVTARNVNVASKDFEYRLNYSIVRLN